MHGFTSNQISAFIDEAESILRRAANLKKKDSGYFNPEKYFGTKLQVLGVSMPVQRELFKKGFSFSDATPGQQLEIYKLIWESTGIYEMRFLCIFFLTKNYKKIPPETVLHTVDNWMDNVDCWPHSDDLAKITCLVASYIPESYKRTILQWNTSENAWKRRQSAVALVRNRTAFFRIFKWSELEKIFIRLLHDEVYMVQKGLGWALRDTGSIYPEELKSFLEKYYRHLSSTAFTTAIEKMTSADKAHFKLKRKEFRTS